MITKTLLSLAIAASLTGCFLDDDDDKSTDTNMATEEVVEETETETEGETEAEEEANLQVASMTDTSEDNTGELRYDFDPLSQGKVSLSVIYPADEGETFYISLFDAGSSTKTEVGDLQLDDGKFKKRIDSELFTATTFIPGTVVEIDLTWDTSVEGAETYSITIDGAEYADIPVSRTNASEESLDVEALSIRFSSNSNVAAQTVLVDNIAIYSDIAGTTKVFSDNFEGYAVGDDLSSVDGTEYHGNTFSTVVAENPEMGF